jgi:predicted alpha/beta hydrolase family esterase
MALPRAFLLLHGYGNHRPPEHWEHWLSLQLEAGGMAVIYPQLPDPEAPSFDGWSAALLGHLEALGARSAAERIVLCHSLSCVLWMRGATGGLITDALAPDRLVLVSPPAPGWKPPAAIGFEPFRVADIDADALRASARTEIRFVGSEGDDYNPLGVESTYARPLGLPFDLIPGAGHISQADGYGPWPAILAWCENPGGPIG